MHAERERDHRRTEAGGGFDREGEWRRRRRRARTSPSGSLYSCAPVELSSPGAFPSVSSDTDQSRAAASRIERPGFGAHRAPAAAWCRSSGSPRGRARPALELGRASPPSTASPRPAAASSSWACPTRRGRLRTRLELLDVFGLRRCRPSSVAIMPGWTPKARTPAARGGGRARRRAARSRSSPARRPAHLS